VLDSKDMIYLVMEYESGGELFDWILNQDKIEEYEARRIFREIVSAVQYLHVHGVVRSFKHSIRI